MRGVKERKDAGTYKDRERQRKGWRTQKKMGLLYSLLESRAIITALLLPLCVLESQIQPRPISIHLHWSYCQHPGWQQVRREKDMKIGTEGYERDGRLGSCFRSTTFLAAPTPAFCSHTAAVYKVDLEFSLISVKRGVFFRTSSCLRGKCFGGYHFSLRRTISKHTPLLSIIIYWS